MKSIRAAALLIGCAGLLTAAPVLGLKSDRQEPLEVNADSSSGTLGDGTAILTGHVEIRQGSLLIRADNAEVEKVDGRVRRVELKGEPVYMEQEIEQEGRVVARAREVKYEVASGMLTLRGDADVSHPQYNISGDLLKYDMNLQHFEGSGDNDSGRIRIRLDPEVVPEGGVPPEAKGEPGKEEDADDGKNAAESSD